MESLSFSRPYSHYTNRFEQQIYECCRETTVAYTAGKFSLCEKTVLNIYEKIAKDRRIKRSSDHPTTIIGIDEIALHKGHKDFVLVITDISNKRIIDILPDRKKETLEEYLKSWSEEQCNLIQGVAIDLWGPYRSVAEEFFPNAIIAADRFHVMQNLNRSLDACRKEEKGSYCSEERKEVWKHAKYTLLKNYENLSDKQKNILVKVLAISSTIKTYYELKEAFRAIFNESTNKEEATGKLYKWILEVIRVEATGYYSFVKTLLNWEDNILNYFVNWLSSGFVEGVNNKIKLIKRKGFGYTNFEKFKLKVIDCFC